MKRSSHVTNYISCSELYGEGYSFPLATLPLIIDFLCLQFALPHIMGWDQYTNQLPHGANQSSPKAVHELQSSEWDR